MAFSTVVFIFGAVLLALGLLGEGVSIKDISIPKIPKASRFLFIVLGTFFLVLGIGIGVADMADEGAQDGPVVVEPAEPQPNPSVPPSTTPENPDLPSTPVSTPPETTTAPSPQPSQVPSGSDEGYREQVRSQMMAISQKAIGEGYQFVDSSVDKLPRNDTDHITLSLQADRSYIAMGVCDGDCRDIDLALYDENSNLISSDAEIDSYPIISVTPKWSGDFDLVVGMPNCGADYCYYGVSLFAEET